MERSRIKRSVTSGIKLKPLNNNDGWTNSRKMERATTVEEIDVSRTKAKTHPPLPFPLIRNHDSPTNKRISSSAKGTSQINRSVDAGQSVDKIRNLPHLDLEDRENRSSAKATSNGRRSNDRGQTFPTIFVNQHTTISTSEVLEDLSVSSSACSEVLHQFRDGQQLTITTNITPVRGRQARRCVSQSAWQPVVTISHSRVLRIIPPIAYQPEDDEDVRGEEKDETRSSSESVIKEGNSSNRTTTSSNGRVPSEPTYMSSQSDATPKNPEISEVMEYINNFDISSSGTSTPKTTFSIRCMSGQTTIESSLVDGYAPSAVTQDLRPSTQDMGVRVDEKLKPMSVGETQDATRKKLDELKGKQRHTDGEWNKQKATSVRRVRHSMRTSRTVGDDCRHETTVTGSCRAGRRIVKRRVRCPAKLSKTAKHPSPDKLPMKDSFISKDKYLSKGMFVSDGPTSGGRYDIEVREESALSPWKSTPPSMNAQRQKRLIAKNSIDSIPPVQTTSIGGSDGGGRASYKTLLETEDSGLDTDPRTDFLEKVDTDRMMRKSIEDPPPLTATKDARMEDQMESKQAPEVGERMENRTDGHVSIDDRRGVGAGSSDYRYESKTVGRRSDGSARELCLLTDSKSSTPAFLEPSQDLDNFSTSSSPIGDELASLPGSPFYRQVLQRRSSSIDSSFSRPGSDFLEVPLLVIQPKDRSPGVCLLDETLTESPPDNSPLNEDPLHGGDLQQQVVHRLSDSVQLPPVTPCQSPEEGVASGQTESRQELGSGIIWKPTMEVSAAAPQVSLTTEDGDDFAVWFGRRGSIFIEEKGAPSRGQQHQLSLLSLTTRNEQGQVSLAVPKSNNN